MPPGESPFSAPIGLDLVVVARPSPIGLLTEVGDRFMVQRLPPQEFHQSDLFELLDVEHPLVQERSRPVHMACAIALIEMDRADWHGHAEKEAAMKAVAQVWDWFTHLYGHDVHVEYSSAAIDIDVDEMGRSYREGDDVRVDLPDPDGPDEKYDGETGTVTWVGQDDLDGLTGDPKDRWRFRVEFDDESLGKMLFRYHDLEPAEEAS